MSIGVLTHNVQKHIPVCITRKALMNLLFPKTVALGPSVYRLLTLK